jgi:hypothetical protein
VGHAIVDVQDDPIVAAPETCRLPSAQLAPGASVAVAVDTQHGFSLHCRGEKHCHITVGGLHPVRVHPCTSP